MRGSKGTQQKKQRWPLVVLVLALVGCIALAIPLHQFIQKSSYPIEYEQQVERWAAEYGIDPLLVYAVIRTESGFNPDAVSSAGARGLTQMTEETFAWVKSKIAPAEDVAFDDLFNPETSIRFGCYYIGYGMDKYGQDVATMAAAYHSGMGYVDKLLQDEEYSSDGQTLTGDLSGDTGHYVDKVLRSYQRYRQIYT